MMFWKLISLVACTLSALSSLSECGSIVTYEYSFPGDVDDIRWVGPGKSVVLFLTSSGEVHRSADTGKRFVSVNPELNGLLQTTEESDSFIKDILVSESNENVVYLISRGTAIYVSVDGARTFKAFLAPSPLEEVALHPLQPQFLLASGLSKTCAALNGVKLSGSNAIDDGKDENGKESCYKSVYVSSNYGESFELVEKYVVQFDWAARVQGVRSSVEDDRMTNIMSILISAKTKKYGDQRFGFWDPNVNLNLYSLTDHFKSKLLVKGGNKFLFLRDFLFVAQVVNDGETEVRLQLSSDALQTFYSGTLPFRLTEHSYTVLDSSEGVVFLHVNHAGDRSVSGHIYVSDSTGMNFTFSLRDNVRDTAGRCDFDKVSSIEGVYLANYVSNPEEMEEFAKKIGGNKKHNSREPLMRIKTVISYDRGGEWAFLRAPQKDSLGADIACVAPGCSLHLNSHTSTYAPLYSSEKAVGLVLGVGNVGASLENKVNEFNTYLSRDGGLNWMEIRKGSHIYEIGDHGGLIAMAKDQEATNKLIYSWKQGAEWTEISFSSSPIDVENIIIEPSATSQVFHVYGSRNTPSGTTGVLITVDFTDLHERECTGASMPHSPSSDYEIWSPRDTPNSPGGFGSQCHLGHITEYVRRKQDAACFNPKRFEASVLVRNCACTEQDYECDFGYYRKSRRGPCVRDLNVKNESLGAPAVCPPSGFYTISNGYRLVGGNTCVGGKDLGPTSFTCSRGLFGVSWSGWLVLTIIAGLLGAMFYQSNKSEAHRALDAFGSQHFGDDENSSCWDVFKELVRSPDARSKLFQSYRRSQNGYFPESAMDFSSGDFGDDFVEQGDEFEFDGGDARADQSESDDDDLDAEAQLISATTTARPLPEGPASTSVAAVPRLTAPPTSTPLDLFGDEDDDLGDDV